MLEINIHYIVRDYILVHQVANIGFIHSDCCIVCCHLPDTRKPCIENRSVQTGLAYYLITAFSVRLLSQLGGNKDHSTKIYESCLTCMLVAVRSECEFVRKFPLKYSRGQRMLCVQEPVVAKQLSMASTSALPTAAEKSFHACVYINDKVCYEQTTTTFCITRLLLRTNKAESQRNS